MNPSRAEKLTESQHPGRGTHWKEVCLGSFCCSLILSAIFKFTDHGESDSDTATIFVGLLALGTLISWTMVGIAGIGWVLTRKR